MRHQPSKFTTIIAYLVALNAFLQVLKHWGEKPVLTLFFLIGGIAMLLLNTFKLWMYKTDHQAIEEVNRLNENGD